MKRIAVWLFIGGLLLSLAQTPVGALSNLLDDESFRSIRQQALDQYGRGEFQKALENEKKIVEMVGERYGPLNPLTAQVWGDLGEIQWNLAQYGEAEKNLKWSLALQERLLDGDDPRLADSMQRLADFYEDLGRYSDALAMEKQAKAILEKNSGLYQKQAALVRLGRLEMETGETRDAEADLSQVVHIAEKSRDPEGMGIVPVLQARAEVFVRLKKWDEAEKDLERVFEITQNRYTGYGVQTADALRALGDFYKARQKNDKAKGDYEQALKIYTQLLTGNKGYMALDTMEKTASVLRSLGRYSEALDWDTQSMDVEKEVYGRGHPRTALCQGRIAWDEELLGKVEQAKSDREAAKEVLKAALGVRHPLLQAIDDPQKFP